MSICQPLSGSASTEKAVHLEVCVANVTCHDRLDSDASDDIKGCSYGFNHVQRIFVVIEIMESRTQCAVVLDEWCTYCVDFLAGQCCALETFRQGMHDDVFKELGG